MDCRQLLDGCSELGCRLLAAGAEIYRVEDTVCHVLAAYGVEGEVFAIPNALIVTVVDGDGLSHTRLRRASSSGIDIDAIECYNQLSRQLCRQLPPAGEIPDMVEQAAAGIRRHSGPVELGGYFLGSFFFTLLFSGSWLAAWFGGVAGLVGGGCSMLFQHMGVNFFLRTVAAAAALGVTVYGLCPFAPVPVNTDMVAIGALMVLVPGMLLTNFMSELVRGDMVSGLSTMGRALLTAGGIAVGMGFVLALLRQLGWPVEGMDRVVEWPVAAQSLMALVACGGFCMMYNIHGVGTLLCCLGGGLSWLVNWWVGLYSDSPYVSTLAAALVVAGYAEGMARIRKCPITAYRVVSFFPLVPGARIYYAMYYAAQGMDQMFLREGLQAVGLAASLAMGALLANSIARVCVPGKGESLRGKV